jgi:ubiquinone/menaquinone biosynthesis C-methylase UbiE
VQRNKPGQAGLFLPQAGRNGDYSNTFITRTGPLGESPLEIDSQPIEIVAPDESFTGIRRVAIDFMITHLDFGTTFCVAQRHGSMASPSGQAWRGHLMAKISRELANLLWRLWYPVLTRLSMGSQVNFLNYGYAYDGSERSRPLLKEQEESDRACIQLYHRVVSDVDLRGLDVLEISCGHGGGAAYVGGYMKPRSMHAVDRNARAIELCKLRHQVDGVTFSCGDACALKFHDSTFDAVINIEASHCYSDVPRFLAEVRRVLRPGGHFLYADFRQSNPHKAVVDRQLEASGLEVVTSKDISANVVRGMQLNTDKYLELIRHLIPTILRRPAMNFAGVKGSAIYRALESGETVYICYHLRKPG